MCYSGGIWQFIQPSVQHRHVTAPQNHVRVGLLLFYGFVTARDSKRQYVDLIVIGPSTTWQARAYLGDNAKKLYIHAHEFLRDPTIQIRENQFLVFHFEKDLDYNIQEHLSEMP